MYFKKFKIIPEKLSFLILYLNLDIIHVLFEYSNTQLFKIESHVLSYLEINILHIIL